ncbi:S-adenosylmethionine decarboxylase proenzyme-like [Acanthaster planci]|uniref:S-adenosylmethionine decarboxylase proenzyme n=1 Tax=Acanthaster planci TaxID=133434 RepID=A0A8B7XPK8_ACAPL|nr:S-adenosylmethionine decarboxylase proenzyme-like [Acanthaster planci]
MEFPGVGSEGCQLTHYEGTEKLLEIWFEPLRHCNGDIQSQGTPDLKVIPRTCLTELLTLVHCEIVSEKCRDEHHAYVLSESSMFLSKERFILKTCGTTTLLNAIEPFIALAKQYCGFKVKDVFYSRKNFFRPELQAVPHRNFQDEVTYLDTLFDSGAAYMLGRVNGDCWHLYTLDTCIGQSLPDQTLEILMTQLDPSVMQHFKDNTGRKAADVTKASGIADLLPNCQIDDFLFEPCGYSMNGLLPKDGYMTIHITPEEEYSYVSFETNIELEDYGDLVNKILTTFNPGKCVMTLFASKAAKCGTSFKALSETFLDKYRRRDRQFSQFQSYDLTFATYIRDKQV